MKPLPAYCLTDKEQSVLVDAIRALQRDVQRASAWYPHPTQVNLLDDLAERINLAHSIVLYEGSTK